MNKSQSESRCNGMSCKCMNLDDKCTNHQSPNTLSAAVSPQEGWESKVLDLYKTCFDDPVTGIPMFIAAIEKTIASELSEYKKSLVGRIDRELRKKEVLDVRDMEGVKLNDSNIKELARRVCDGRQNIVIDSVLAIIKNN